MDVLVPAVVALCLLALVARAAMALVSASARGRVLSRQDADELDAVGRSLLAERHADVAAQLGTALETLRRRRVPLGRVVGGGGVRGQGVLEFSDGTRILARSVKPLDLGSVAVAVVRGRVLLHSWSDDGSGLSVELVWSGGRRTVEAVAIADAVSE